MQSPKPSPRTFERIRSMGDSMAHSFENRPWGTWHVLDEGDGYKVKRLEIEAHQRLSYQIHAYRAELWIVVSGEATCLIDGRTIVALPGDCVEIGVGVAHRISNVRDEELVIIEIQRGTYTGEDDITRLEDDYGRACWPDRATAAKSSRR